MAALPNRYFHVWRMAADSVETIAVLSLPQFPRMNGGGFFGSPAEARPSWDLRAGCLALMDGSTNRLLLVDVRTGMHDSLALPLPERFVDVEAANATLPADAMPQGDVELPGPALLARYVDLLIAPDGWLWIRPVFQAPAPQPEGIGSEGVDDERYPAREVWRYHLTTGQFAIDTVAGFPRGFTPAGTPFRTETDDEGVTRIFD